MKVWSWEKFVLKEIQRKVIQVGLMEIVETDRHVRLEDDRLHFPVQSLPKELLFDSLKFHFVQVLWHLQELSR